MMNVKEIQKVIPHRYPFLFVDRIIELEPGKRAVGIKNVSINEPFFQGHFPERPIMPGVLILEALTQTAGIAMAVLDENNTKLGMFTGVESAKFMRPVVPGDVLMLEAEIIAFKLGIVRAKVKATVDGQIAAEALVKFFLVDRNAPIG